MDDKNVDVTDFFRENDNLDLLRGIKRGIERECLRVDQDGRLSSKLHPKGLGSSLTHPFITTDFSECLLEFITPAQTDLKETLSCLEKIHKFCLSELGEEILWNSSMPCVLGNSNEIPIAEYGSSNIGRMKNIYRKGLDLRYGSLMQVISGLHFNFSFPDEFWEKLKSKKEKTNESLQEFKSSSYMGLIRNFHRFSWVIPYFFGASPALCKSFITASKKEHQLQDFDGKGTLFGSFATSLRMSDLGYQNKRQDKLSVNYNSLKGYVDGLEEAIFSVDENWKKLGVKKNGEYIQLNDSILQIENEYYGTIRPKRVAFPGERPATALKERGIEYIELRSVDINPFSPIGITEEQIRFLDIFITFCLFQDSRPLNPKESNLNSSNLKKVVLEGRKPGLMLFNEQEKESSMEQLLNEVMANMLSIAKIFDRLDGENSYCEVIEDKKKEISDPELTLSGQFLNELKKSEKTFFYYTLDKSKKLKEQFLQNPLSENQLDCFKVTSAKSLKSQKKLEESDKISIDEYIKDYFKK